ncbi:chemotaxis protein [Streptomyces sp. GMY02]|uniref:baeRF3 domain-containing protein n=1 Tax=Streptomyces sp. GMY02 TaxID=1333528 RepID=UPI001C2BB0A6|nr:chemotaxis protein [Streptomyces sp. GMY02]QXE38554.1 chemotaxis protein [Streptomyces sp. GMY02]
MDNNGLTPDVLRELRRSRPYPAVSLTMPTHRRDPRHEQDTVRLRNLLTEAAHRLEADPEVDKRARTALSAQLGRALTEVDLRRALDGLLILADGQEHRIWYLPREVPERVVLSDSYLTRNLVAATAQSRPYWVLGVAADRATLWSGTGESLREHRGNGFPMAPPEESWDVEREERIGDTPSTFSDEETRKFLRSVDDAMGAVLARRPRPFYLVGLAPALALLEEAGSATRPAAGRLVKGGLADGPAPVLLKELRPVVEEYARREKDDVLNRLDEARGRRTFAAGLDEVWESVRGKRADLIALEEHYRRTVRVCDGHLVPVDEAALTAAPASRAAASGDGGRNDVRDDIVDELVETALDGGAEVVFLPDGTLAAHDRIAAVLRY